MSDALRILAIDDDDVMRSIYRHILTANDCEIFEAATGEAGLALLAGRPFDCVLLDFRMTDMSGLKFLQQRRAAGLENCALIMITAYDSAMVAKRVLLFGHVEDFMLKDEVAPSTLLASIREAITKYRSK